MQEICKIIFYFLENKQKHKQIECSRINFHYVLNLHKFVPHLMGNPWTLREFKIGLKYISNPVEAAISLSSATEKIVLHCPCSNCYLLLHFRRMAHTRAIDAALHFPTCPTRSVLSKSIIVYLRIAKTSFK